MRFKALETQTNDEDEKGRSFTSHLLLAICESNTTRSSATKKRPQLFAYCGTSSQVKSFTANLKLGQPAVSNNHRFELLRSAGYRWIHNSPISGESLVVAYLPDLFHLEPGSRDARRIEFLTATPEAWIDRQAASLKPRFDAEEARIYAQAADVVARLNARSALPIANDLAFHRALYDEAMAEGWLSRAEVLGDPSDLGLAPPLYLSVSTEDYRDFLARVTRRELPRLEHAPPTPVPAAATAQLSLFAA